MGLVQAALVAKKGFETYAKCLASSKKHAQHLAKTTACFFSPMEKNPFSVSEGSYVAQCSSDLEEALRRVVDAANASMPRIVTVPTEAEDAAKTLGARWSGWGKLCVIYIYISIYSD